MRDLEEKGQDRTIVIMGGGCGVQWGWGPLCEEKDILAGQGQCEQPPIGKHSSAWGRHRAQSFGRGGSRKHCWRGQCGLKGFAEGLGGCPEDGGNPGLSSSWEWELELCCCGQGGGHCRSLHHPGPRLVAWIRSGTGDGERQMDGQTDGWTDGWMDASRTQQTWSSLGCWTWGVRGARSPRGLVSAWVVAGASL